MVSIICLLSSLLYLIPKYSWWISRFRNCNGIFLIGDFNVDFDHSRMFNSFSVWLHNCMNGIWWLVTYLFVHVALLFTRMKEMMGIVAHGLIVGWSSYLLLVLSSIVSDVSAHHSESNLCDHSPLQFLIHIQGQSILSATPTSHPTSNEHQQINWSRNLHVMWKAIVIPSLCKACNMLTWNCELLAAQVMLKHFRGFSVGISMICNS